MEGQPTQSTNRTALIDAAMATIKENLTAVKKDDKNPHFGNTFASLNAHLKLVEPLVKSVGCVLTQPTIFDGRTGQNVVVSKITHSESGQSIEASLSLGEQKDMQKLGSAITYARRYTLGSLLAMQAEDDDGNAASGTVKTKKSVAKKGDF